MIMTYNQIAKQIHEYCSDQPDTDGITDCLLALIAHNHTTTNKQAFAVLKILNKAYMDIAHLMKWDETE